MSKLFNANMSSTEASTAFFEAAAGKTREERDKIFDEYAPIARAIRAKESELVQQGWLFE